MRVLITGGSGVIGLNLVDQVMRDSRFEKAEIYLMHTRTIPFKALREIDPQQRCIHVRDIKELSLGRKFDLILNCSGVSQPKLFTSQPENLVFQNINQALALIETLSDEGKFVHMSTSEIYSGCQNRPCSEDHRGEIAASNPRRTYIMCKEISELALSSAFKVNQTLVILRLSLIFGKYYLPPDERVLYSFLEQSLRGTIAPRGGLDNIRRYLSASDLYRVIPRLLDNLNGGTSVYNIGGSKKITIKDLANRIAEITDCKLDFSRTIIEPDGAPDEVWVNCDKIKKIVGSFEFTPIEETLREAFLWRSSLNF